MSSQGIGVGWQSNNSNASRAKLLQPSNPLSKVRTPLLDGVDTDLVRQSGTINVLVVVFDVLF